jgi:hypothetical protein
LEWALGEIRLSSHAHQIRVVPTRNGARVRERRTLQQEGECLQHLDQWWVLLDQSMVAGDERGVAAGDVKRFVQRDGGLRRGTNDLSEEDTEKNDDT